MWRLISKIFENQYGSKEYNFVNGIGEDEPP
jgi:hypothetical protein